MKKYLLLLVTIVLSNLAILAQTAEIVDPESIIEGTLGQTEMSVHWDVVNTSKQTIDYRARRIVGEEVQGSTNNFCWAGLCYGPGTDTSSVNLLASIESNGSDDTFTGYYYHNGNEGCTRVTYCFYDFNNEEDEVCHEVVYTVNCTVSVSELGSVVGELGQISPNPVTSRGTFTYSMNTRNNNSSIFIYNMVGELVKEIPLNSEMGLVVIDKAEFESGVYFYSLVSNNQVLSTKKMVIQN